MKEFRAYREPGSLKVLVEMEFESMEAGEKHLTALRRRKFQTSSQNLPMT
jgi:hypothetical protein